MSPPIRWRSTDDRTSRKNALGRVKQLAMEKAEALIEELEDGTFKVMEREFSDRKDAWDYAWWIVTSYHPDQQ